eukprot:CAMPEP_0182434002 /NCGR_PEP_ID=MMETSP1167-20130531/66960_1 /TAXON_ID=2988 /ORGANISM="Mallomonas Sp, Strain CCMP3275" /LENGTH=129 /DNA_ID=CAMNT_0024623357 /DNA_START=404 /DNA_END=793 /DNA_ORIENTATION=-
MSQEILTKDEMIAKLQSQVSLLNNIIKEAQHAEQTIAILLKKNHELEMEQSVYHLTNGRDIDMSGDSLKLLHESMKQQSILENEVQTNKVKISRLTSDIAQLTSASMDKDYEIARLQAIQIRLNSAHTV